MSTTGTANTILSTLLNTNGYVALAIEVAGELVPIGKALVTGIKQIAQGGKTVTYQVLLQMDAAELDAIDKLSTDDLTAINVELVKLGLAPVPVPGATPPTPPITQ
jgi:hypothetical protein